MNASARPDTAEHRPPSGAPIMRQDWCRLLFLHWSVDAGALQALIPDGLRLDTHQGKAYIGLTPFELRNLKVPMMPAIPYLSTFLECNLRTYVRAPGGIPGIYFFSLEAERSLAVMGARMLRLPYFKAEMEYRRDGSLCEYESRRMWPQPDTAFFRARWKVEGEVGQAAPGTLRWFLYERYCLFNRLPGGRIQGIRVHHEPWRLRQATLLDLEESLTSAAGLPALNGAPVVDFSEGVHASVWAPEIVGKAGP